MTAQKLRFTVEDVEVIKENPNSNFALLNLDFFASGENLHDMYVSEDTLMRTADTIKNCPLVWKYDPTLDDVYTHDPEEVPCGFVPETSTVKTKKLDDGRTMLSTIAYVWKRYTGELLNFFKRDGGKKPVSVEMSVYKTKPMENGKVELLDFRYEGITVLGSFVTPAIPLAAASVLSFAEQLQNEYVDDFEKEFSLDNIIIPIKVKENAERGLELRKLNKGGTSAGLAFARFYRNNKTISPKKIIEINNYFSTHKFEKLNKPDSDITEDTDWLLWGGDYAKGWAEKVLSKMGELLTFPYKSKGEINPALKGITPPISLAQANAIANQADSIGSDDKKNGWAIAISSFKKTHHVEDEKWVKNKGSEAQASFETTEEEMAYWGDIVEEDFAAEDMGKGETISVNKSKEEISNSPWEGVDKTELQHKVLKASNYKSLAHDIYLVVESGWEEHPSSSLKYPVMQIVNGTAVYNRNALASALGRAKGQNEGGVVSKLNGLYEKLGLNSDKKEMSMAEEEIKMAATEEVKPEEEKTETPEEEKKEPEEKQKAEEKSGVEKKFTLPVTEMAKFFAEDEEAEDCKMAKAEIAKGEEADFGLIMNAVYGKFCKAQEMCVKMAEEKKVYMAENEELKKSNEDLKKFKAMIEGQQKEFAINETLKDISTSVILPDDVRAELRAEADNYTLENLETWKNIVKAKSFDFAIRQPKDTSVIKVGLPFTGATKKPKSIWD